MSLYIHNGSTLAYLALWNNRSADNHRKPYRRIQYNPWKPEYGPCWVQALRRTLPRYTQQRSVYHAHAV